MWPPKYALGSWLHPSAFHGASRICVGEGGWDMGHFTVCQQLYPPGDRDCYPHFPDGETEAQSSHPIQLVQDGAGVQTQIFLAPRLLVFCCASLAYLRLTERQKSHLLAAVSLGKRAGTNRFMPI